MAQSKDVNKWKSNHKTGLQGTTNGANRCQRTTIVNYSALHPRYLNANRCQWKTSGDKRKVIIIFG